MIEQILQQVSTGVSGERALEGVRTLTRFHRVQSSPGYAAAARWIAAELESSGVAYRWLGAPGDGRTRALAILQPRGWECTAARAWLHDHGRRELICDYDEQKLSLVLRSTSARGRFPLVALEDGSAPEHYEGKNVRDGVVLSSAPVHRVHELAVVERGAAGILSDTRRVFPPVRRESDERDAHNYTSFWWAEDTPRGWGFVVTPERGDALRAALADGADLAIEVSIDANERDVEVPLLTAELPGTVPGEVLLLAHLCHPEPSANDNASGASALLETARALHGMLQRGELAPARRTIRFLWMPELTGTAAWLAHNRELTKQTLAALNLDMVGEDQAQCGSTLHVERPPLVLSSFAETLLRLVRDRSQDWVTSYSGSGHYSLLRKAEIPYGGGSDHAVLLDPSVGVPCPMLIQWPDRFYHSSHDTPDRTDPASLALAARCAAAYAAFLAGAGDEEASWLLDAVARNARREVLDAYEGSDPAREIVAARLRGHRALDSLSRLAVTSTRIEAARSLFETFCAGEGMPPSALKRQPPADGVRAQAGAAAACPRRLVAGPLEFHAHLLPGYTDLDTAERRRLQKCLDRLPGGRLTVDLAWMNCNGQRSIDEIAWLIWLETGAEVPAEGDASDLASLSELFRWTERLGLTSMRPDAKEVWNLGRDRRSPGR